MSYYAAFLGWWYADGAQPNKVVIVDEAQLQAAIQGLAPVPERPARAHSQPPLFREMRARWAQLRYERNLRLFESMVHEMKMP